MSLVLPTGDGLLEIFDHQLQAVIHSAERRAELTAAALDAIGIFKSGPCRLPAAFLLELSAVLELALWERQNIRAHLDIDLPIYREAADALRAGRLGACEVRGTECCAAFPAGLASLDGTLCLGRSDTAGQRRAPWREHCNYRLLPTLVT